MCVCVCVCVYVYVCVCTNVQMWVSVYYKTIMLLTVRGDVRYIASFKMRVGVIKVAGNNYN